MKIVLIEPFYTGSHQSWVEGFKATSRHDITILSLTGKNWKWYSMNEPGLSEDASELLLSRNIKAIGSDTVACGTALKDGKTNPDAPPPNYCWIHNNLLPKDILIIECLANMEQVPNACFFMALPLKIKSGSGSPIRPVAVVL